MDKYAVIEINGNQHLVREKEEFLVDYLKGKKPEAKVLLVANGEKLDLGQPEVKGVKVSLKVVEEKVQGTKLHVKKFKAKSRYRRKIGFRPLYTRLAVQKIA